MMISTGGKSAPLMADTSPSCFTMLAASVHQHTGTNDIGLEEDARIFDGAVNVGLCRKVDHDVRMLFFKQLIHSFAVANVGLHKAEIRVVHNRCQCGQIASVGQLVHAERKMVQTTGLRAIHSHRRILFCENFQLRVFIDTKIQFPVLTLWAVVFSDDRESQLVYIKILGGIVV